MKKLIIVALAMACTCVPYAQAVVQTVSLKSSHMVKTCSVENEAVADAACQGFVFGVADTTAFYGAGKLMKPPFCIPRETAPGELLAVFRDYINKNKGVKHFPAAALAIAAFKDAFPCNSLGAKSE
jgi:hypothetical protein